MRAEAHTRIVFTDAGIDDALALIFLGYSGARMDYIVCCGGNVDAKLVGNNCALLKELFALDGRLYQGSNPPGHGLLDASDVHGPTGLGGYGAPERRLPPYAALLPVLEARAGSLDVLVLGPGTDAAALLAHPELKGRVKGLVVMGGAFERRGPRLGNVTPYAEFNVFMDPGAAWELMAAPCPSTWVPLDSTEAHLYSEREILEGIEQGERGKFVRDLFQYSACAHRRIGCGDGMFMHDVLAAAVWAGLVGGQPAVTRVREVVRCGERRGLIVHRPVARTGRNVTYLRALDGGAFLERWRQMVVALR